MEQDKIVGDAGNAPNEWPAHVAALPGPVTLTAIRDSEPARLSPAQLVDAINCSERLMSHLAGLQATLITEFARPGRAGDIAPIVEAFCDFGGPARHTDGTLDTELLHTLVADHSNGMAAAEIAAALHISPITARHRVDKAIDLHDGLPATLRALTAGRIDRGRAAMIAEHTAILDDPELRAAVEEKILPLAETRTAGRLRPLVDRAVIIADPDAAERRVKKARRGREVTHQPGKDDMSVIRAALPADGAVTVYTLIDLIAASTKTPGDDRGIGERRADALTDIAHQLLSHGHLDLRGLLRNPDDDNEDDDDWSDGGHLRAHPDLSDPDDDYDREARDNAWQHIDHWNSNPDGDANLQTSESPATESAANQQVTPETASQGRGTAPRGQQTDQQEAFGDPMGSTNTDQESPFDSAPDAAAKVHCTTSQGPLDSVSPETTDDRQPHQNADHKSDVEPPVVEPTTSNDPPATPPAAQPTEPAGQGSSRLLSRQGRRPHLTLTMSMSTLMALDRLPGHLDGYGAVTAELANAIAAAARSLSLVIVDPETGSPLRAGERHTYKPRQRQRDITTTLFDTCRFPSCRQPSWRCDLDHRQPFDHQHPDAGGQTCDNNLDPYCRRHHLLKHHSDWTPKRQPDGTIEWSSPTRHTYIDQPRELTLPGELTHPEPAARYSIGLADHEHMAECADPAEPEEPTPTAYYVKQAVNREFQRRVRERFDYLKKVIAMPPPSDAGVKPHQFETFTVKSRADALRREFEEANATQTAAVRGLLDDDLPPF